MAVLFQNNIPTEAAKFRFKQDEQSAAMDTILGDTDGKETAILRL